MFRSAGPELAALLATGTPFFGTPWRADEVGVRLDASTDWEELAELVTESYCLLAPAKLAQLVDRPRCVASPHVELAHRRLGQADTRRRTTSRCRSSSASW